MIYLGKISLEGLIVPREPKAIPWTHLTPLKADADGWCHMDIRKGDVVTCPTNLGWMKGPWLVFASLLNGASMALYNGSPNSSGFAKFIQIHGGENGPLWKDYFEGGATWAFDVGSQCMTCPIIVEDLDRPRQMLVEMLCEDRGIFSEIADFIKGLGLTILRGVMEARKSKIWACFTVEVLSIILQKYSHNAFQAARKLCAVVASNCRSCLMLRS